MKTYLDQLQHILDNGSTRDDRTGVGTISCFGLHARYHMADGFPAVTTKKLAWKV
ncbi:MAG: thymidylate synthase, partial [Pseudomonadales bacterium]|nr:thymidylate synthase [Pseudomonadales bacterium]